jgi:hypothetical protein
MSADYDVDPKCRPLIQSKADGRWYPEQISEFTAGQAVIVAELLGLDVFSARTMTELRETLSAYVKDKNE